MTLWMTMVTPILVIITLICVIIQRQHLLMILLSLEMMILSLVTMMISILNISWVMFVITLLTFGACEAGLGLACMTAMSRSYGNDRMNSLLSNKC